MLNFASFGADFQDTANGLEYNFKIDDTTTNTGTLTISKIENVSDDKVPIDDDGMPKREVTEGGVNSVIERSGFFNTTVKTVIISEGVTSIGNNAFNDCRALTTVTFEETTSKLKTIGNNAFNRCTSLESAIIPKGVKKIGNDAFFACTALTSATIPSSVETIGDAVFSCCKSLPEIIVEEGNAQYKDIDGVLSTKDGKQLMCYPAGKVDTSYIIPNSVETIGVMAFYECKSLTSVTMPNSVTKIGECAFDINGGGFLNVYYIGSRVEWNKITIDMFNDAIIHYTGETLTVKKVWQDNKNSSLRSKPTLVLYTVTKDENGDSKYKIMGANEYKQYNFTYTNDVPVKFDEDTKKVTDGNGEDVWLCKITIFYYYFDENHNKKTQPNTYAVSEDPMEGYTSTAPTPKLTTKS